MSQQGLSIAEAAKALGVSTRTIRRFIKAGKLNAHLVDGPFGQEYRIPELPAELQKRQSPEVTIVQPPAQPASQPRTPAPAQNPALLDMLQELQEKNTALDVQLNAANERIHNLERDLRLLAAASQPWWKRFFGRIVNIS